MAEMVIVLHADFRHLEVHQKPVGISLRLVDETLVHGERYIESYGEDTIIEDGIMVEEGTVSFSEQPV